MANSIEVILNARSGSHQAQETRQILEKVLGGVNRILPLHHDLPHAEPDRGDGVLGTVGWEHPPALQHLAHSGELAPPFLVLLRNMEDIELRPRDERDFECVSKGDFAAFGKIRRVEDHLDGTPGRNGHESLSVV